MREELTKNNKIKCAIVCTVKIPIIGQKKHLLYHLICNFANKKN